MNLYIEVKNGVAQNHPAFEDNLIEAFGAVPAHWEPFVRVERPTLDVYEIMDQEEPVYSKVNGIWTDVWLIRGMTVEEKAVKQQAIRDEFNYREQSTNWSAWVLDEAICKMVPPIPRPEPDQTKLDVGIRTFWCGADSNWKDTPPCPDADNQYKFDFFAWQWVQFNEN
jgi:hypothetical protein